MITAGQNSSVSMRDMGYSQRWRFKSRSSGLWLRVVLSVVVGYQCDEGNVGLRNADILPQHYTASQPRRTGLKFSIDFSHKQVPVNSIQNTRIVS